VEYENSHPAICTASHFPAISASTTDDASAN
jgi:hypothetical protein